MQNDGRHSAFLIPHSAFGILPSAFGAFSIRPSAFGFQHSKEVPSMSEGPSFKSFLIGAGIGAAIMYFLDPNRGARRRHLVYDRAGRTLREGRRQLYDVKENVKNHALGKVREAKKLLRSENVEDERLVERVRAELGHQV